MTIDVDESVRTSTRYTVYTLTHILLTRVYYVVVPTQY